MRLTHLTVHHPCGTRTLAYGVYEDASIVLFSSKHSEWKVMLHPGSWCSDWYFPQGIEYRQQGQETVIASGMWENNPGVVEEANVRAILELVRE